MRILCGIFSANSRLISAEYAEIVLEMKQWWVDSKLLSTFLKFKTDIFVTGHTMPVGMWWGFCEEKPVGNGTEATRPCDASQF